jgi:ABC-type transport system involved in multi-copper enzyme maturation permease subunit
MLLPAIERELRAAARHSFTYSSRVIGVMALLAVFGMVVLEQGLGRGVGGKLFGYLHCALFFSIWVLVPLLTADCISRERREGTLPLLFLTPLRPTDIVNAKGMAHGLCAFTLWLAVVPILTVPFLLGGVSWPEVALSILVNCSSICLAIGAGLVGSATSKTWTQAIVLALMLSLGLLILYLCWLPLSGAWLASARTLGAGRYGPGFGFAAAMNGVFSADEPLLLSGYASAINWGGCWQWLLRTSRTPWPCLALFGTATLVSILTLLALSRLAAWRVSRVWRDQPPSARVAWLKNKLFTPFLFQRLLRRWLRWKLDRNPIGWLEQRSWSGRLVVWSWLAVVVCIYSSLFLHFSMYQRAFHALQSSLAFLLALSIALSAAGSFRREHETGVLELLLVAPLHEEQILYGRLRGLWGQFMPAAVLLFAVWLYCGAFLSDENEVVSVLVYAVTFATLPVIGLYFSLAKKNFIAALLWTLLVGMAGPSGVAVAAQAWVGHFSWFTAMLTPPGVNLMIALIPPSAQILTAQVLGWYLHENLKSRKFALEGRML